MKIIIKDTPVNAIQIEDKFIISDADANKIINSPKRTKRGRLISKEKLVDTSNRYFVNNSLHYALVVDLDDCYHNNVILNK